ncbi:TfdA family taurine dioxygenase [Amylocarpus encephaloides]|uniref:TfdA family taurine dioxygenase n=1 Tax=Amylocarpus encephaloides TaxID=45428 RepID=A0A9P7YAT8_9HELO|nr:TfdA family taurine dioxygenase [Amylocarpus encephaloides]
MTTNGDESTKLRYRPMKYSGSLDHLDFVEVTPIIGREYTKAKITDILAASNSEAQLRDLAVVISERGVCFFREPQTDLSVDGLKQFTDSLGRLSGRPEENGLHVHPLYRDPGNSRMGNGETDENIYVINSEAAKKLYKTMPGRSANQEPRDLTREWHSDATFENCPSDFSCLLMEETPPHGGDTLWCSGYEIYDRISPTLRTLLSTLTATCSQPVFASACASGSYPVMTPRGSPLNTDLNFSPVHPVVRTVRQTGWRSLFAPIGLHVSKINGLYKEEERMLREYVMRLVTGNHDCVARMRWTRGAVAVWNNAAVWHAATPDTHLVPGAVRNGIRASSIGEVPFLDSASRSRRETLGLDF